MASYSDDIIAGRKDLSIVAYVESHAAEIRRLTKATSVVGASRNAIQALPNHMRRRAASHNIKRIPQRLRKRAHSLVLQNQSQKRKKSSKARPSSRYHRRRPSNICPERSAPGEALNCSLLGSETKKSVRERDWPAAGESPPKRAAWLETHVWHAKRFHMEEHWGFGLPISPTDKGGRSFHRALKGSAVIQDMSYFAVMEISGNGDAMKHLLKRITSQEDYIRLCLPDFTAGAIRQEVTLYREESCPFGAVSEVGLLWKPQVPECSGHSELLAHGSISVPEHLSVPTAVPRTVDRCMWMWVHPAGSRDVVDLLQSVIANMKTTAEAEAAAHVVLRSTPMNTFRLLGPQSHEVLRRVLQPAVISVSPNTDDITGSMESQNYPPKLTGGKKKVTDLNKGGGLYGGGRKLPKDESENEASLWWEDHFCGTVGSESERTPTDRKSLHELQTREFQWMLDSNKICGLTLTTPVTGESTLPISKSTSCGECSRCLRGDSSSRGYRTVLGLVVKDPRVLAPPMKMALTAEPLSHSVLRGSSVEDSSETKSSRSEVGAAAAAAVSVLPWSPLWDPEVRERVKHERRSDSELNQLKATAAQKSEVLSLGNTEEAIPILLIPVTGSPSSPPEGAEIDRYGAGYDIIVPAGCGKSFWMSLVYAGARAGGLKQREAILRESGRLCFPNDFPDTPAGQMCETSEAFRLAKRHMRFPPDKRPSFNRLRVAAPFTCPWSQLTATTGSDLLSGGSGSSEGTDQKPTDGETSGSGQFFVSRDTYLLDLLGHALGGKLGKATSNTGLTKGSNSSDYTYRQNEATSGSSSPVASREEAVKCAIAMLRQLESSSPGGSVSSLKTTFNRMCALVPVRVTTLRRGSVEPHAGVYVLSACDVEKLSCLGQERDAPVEPLPSRKRKSVPAAGTLTSSKRKKEECKGQEVRDDYLTVTHSSSPLQTYASRNLVGSVKAGGFSLRHGTCSGSGFVSAVGMAAILETNLSLIQKGNLGKKPDSIYPIVALVRSSNSRHYHYVRLEI